MIRLANKFDNERIKEFLIAFHEQHPNRLSMKKENWSSEYVDQQLSKIYAGAGFVLIADDGFLCAIRSPCFWIPNVWTLQETMWFAKSKKNSLKLMKKYIEIGNEMKKNSEIEEFYISSFGDVDLSKIGATKICNDWVM